MASTAPFSGLNRPANRAPVPGLADQGIRETGTPLGIRRFGTPADDHARLWAPETVTTVVARSRPSREVRRASTISGVGGRCTVWTAGSEPPGKPRTAGTSKA